MTYNRAAITTVDNPFDPFDEFDKWNRYDIDCGYNSASYLARIAKVNDSLSDVEYCKEVERAIDQIVLNDPTNLYRKVLQTVEVSD